MTFAIQHTLLYPDRAVGVDNTVDFTQCLNLDFRPPDFGRFPCLQHAIDAMTIGGIAPAVFNAANEVAVDAFLQESIGYLDIARVIEHCLKTTHHFEPDNLDAVLTADAEARSTARACIANL